MFRRALVGGSIATAAVLALSACGSDAADDGDSTTLTVAATPVPHAEILQFVSDELAADADLTVEIEEFTDYVQPNLVTDDGTVDANFFQTVPYLDTFNAENGTDLVTVVPVHVEPMGLYSDSLTSIDDLGDGDQIAIPSDASNGGRALALLADAGLITLDDSVDATTATEDNVVENPLNLVFEPVDAAVLPTILPDVAAAVINGNYALEADLSPAEDALASESVEDNPYANYLVVQADNVDDENIAKLAELLNSDEVRQFIEETYPDGSVVPAF